MGAAFFREATRLQATHGRPGTIVANSLQTNAGLVDDELAAHLAEFRFLVGCSLDGPRDLHDTNRRAADGSGTHGATLRGIATLQRHGVAVNVLCLVTREHAGRARELLRYFADLGLPWQQYIPYVARGPGGPGGLTGPQWGDFLCELFDAWLEAGPDAVSVRLFDAVLGRALGAEAWSCHLADDCRQHLVVEHDGSIFPCDFFVAPQWRLGNLHRTPLGELARSRAWADFGAAKRVRDPVCAECFCRDLCRGDCPRHRAPGAWPPSGRSELCVGWQGFFAHAARRLTARTSPAAATGAHRPPRPRASSA